MAQEHSSPENPRHISSRANHPDVREVLPLFIARLPARVARLGKTLAAGDLAAFQDAIHQLKGAGESYGFAPITAYAASVENLIADGRPPAEIETALKGLVGYIERIEGYKAG